MCEIPASTRFAAATAVRGPQRLAALIASLALVALVALLHVAPAHAEGGACTKYASTSGSDSAPGSASEPYATLTKLASSLAPGQTGCLQSGQVFDTAESVTLEGEAHGVPGAPITITSTEPSDPAIVTHSLSLAQGADWVTFTHLVFHWAMPKPWTCWNAAGNPTGLACGGSQPQNTEDGTQIAVNAHHDSFTYDDISSEGTDICVNSGTWNGSTSEYLLLEHDRIHGCGPAITGAKKVNEENGWHDHGVYDYGRFTTIRNSYIYDNSRNGILFYPTGEGGVAEHNIIDANGNGITFGPDRKVLARFNIITNSTSACGRRCFDWGISTNEAGPGDEAADNCLDGNLSGEISAPDVTLRENKVDTNPLYANAAAHRYALSASSPCLGYGPDTAQPGQSEPSLTGFLEPTALTASALHLGARKASRARVHVKAYRSHRGPRAFAARRRRAREARRHHRHRGHAARRRHGSRRH